MQLPSFLSHPTSDVLNPGLYARLERLFGYVIVHHRGEEMNASFVLDPYSGKRRLEGVSKGEYYAIDCPFCGDTRKRLWVNYKYGQPGASGEPMRFLAVCYNETQCLSNIDNSNALYRQVFGAVNAVSQFQVLPGRQLTQEELDPSEPPGDVIPLRSLPDDHPAVGYMVHTRDFAMSLLSRYEVGYCVFAKRKYANAADRIVFPVRFRGELVGWQARQLFDYQTVDDVMKYYTKPNMPRSKILYNYDAAVSGPFGLLVEGVMHVLRVPEVGLATFGSQVSDEQLRLASTGFIGKPLLVCLDPDAVAKQVEVVAKLRAMHSGPVCDIRLAPGYDVDRYRRDELFRYFSEQAAAQGVVLTCPTP